MNKKYHCKNCSYFFGKEEIHCAVHPCGKESEYCKDWRKETVMQKLVEIAKSRSINFSSKETYTVLLGIVSASLLGYALYQTVPAAIEGYENYNRYTKECEIFLQRAGNAGTTAVAQEQLAKAVSWLEAHNSTQTFEYKDLKNNLDYLKEQPRNILTPTAIKDSLVYSIDSIQKKELEKRFNSSSGLQLIITLIMIILTSLMMLFLSDVI